MKKLKNILRYKLFILLIITIIYTYFITNNLIYKTYYSEGYNTIYGTIVDIVKKEDYVTFTLWNKEKIKVNYYDSFDYQIGDYVKLEGNLKIPSSNTIFNIFNYRLYLMSNKIYYVMTAENIEKIKDSNFLYKIKNNIYNKIDSLKSKTYIKTFVLGDKSDLSYDMKSIYQQNGVSHLLAISGMHVSLLASILNVLLKKIKFKHYLISVFLIFYSFLTNFTPSIIRATLFFMFSKKIDIKKLIIIVFCLMLIYNPYYIYNVGFLFSFVVSFYLIMFSKIINKYKNYFVKVFIISLISFLAGLPIMINNFYNINIISVFLNVVFVPFVSFIVFPLSLLTLFFNCLDNVLYFAINILESLSLFFNKFNVNLVMCSIPFYIVILYYFLITFILIKPKYFYILIIVILLHHNIKIFSGDYLTILDVGQGDSLLLELKDTSLLIDTGGIYSDYSITINKTIPYLKSRGIKKLDYLILTHGDYDHIGEVINLVNNFEVDNVVFNCGEINKLEQSLIDVLDYKKIKYYTCIKQLNIDNNKLYFLNDKDYGNENDNSNVIYAEISNNKFLFMGDAGVEVEDDLLEKYNLSDIDVLKVGHHGSKTSSSIEFINSIKPKYSVISVGVNNRYGHPNDNVLDNLSNSKIYRTDNDGSIMFKIKKNKLQIETCVS